MSKICVDILIIEDNPHISDTLLDFLQKDGYSCHIANSGESGLNYIKNNDIKIVLLDIMLPGLDGLQVCDEIHRTKNLPIIILSAKTEKDDKLNGFLFGADDYIEKPFDIDLLLAKVRSLYRRHYDKSDVITAGNIVMDKIARTVIYKNNPLNLNVKEFDLLLFLMENQGKALRKDHIFNSVWGMDSFSEPSTLTVHINWLREKIEDNPREPRYIMTVWGVGYKFEVKHE